jgi:hypothetical protein
MQMTTNHSLLKKNSHKKERIFDSLYTRKSPKLGSDNPAHHQKELDLQNLVGFWLCCGCQVANQLQLGSKTGP